MRRPSAVTALLLVVLVGVAMILQGCPADFEGFTLARQQPVVRMGAGASSLAALPDATPRPFPTGYYADTDTNGEGLLEGRFSSGSKCYVHIFDSSGFRMAACTKFQYEAGDTVSCQEEGATLYRECQSHLITTPSGQIKAHSALLVVVVPKVQLTLVAVLEGAATVVPLTDIEGANPGSTFDVGQGSFVYTAPDEMLRKLGDLGGVPPRQPVPFDALPPVVARLQDFEPRIVAWLERGSIVAGREGLPFPPISEADRRPAAVTAPTLALAIEGGGGALSTRAAGETLAMSVPWPDLLASSFPGETVELSLQVAGNDVDFEGTPYDPDRAPALWKRVGLDSAIAILAPAEDERLLEMGRRLIELLARAHVDASLRAVSGADLAASFKVMMAAGEPALMLRWQ